MSTNRAYWLWPIYCKTLKHWYKLAEKRGHDPFWARKRWEMRRKKKPKNNYDDDKYFNF